ncbi:MAG: trypsin-like serine protease [Acidobacteriota bacterium]
MGPSRLVPLSLLLGLSLFAASRKIPSPRIDTRVLHEDDCLTRTERQRDFPAVVRASGSSHFTAALVGPRVLLTAAHTVEDDDNPILATHNEGQIACCDLHPDYSSDDGSSADDSDLRRSSVDLALCRLADPLQLTPQGARYESISLGPYDERTTLTVMGFGPTRRGGPTHTCLAFKKNVDIIRQASESHWIEVDACLTGGDSGGPAFMEEARTSSRRIVGVNAKGPCSGEDDDGDYSLLTSTSSPAISEWIQAWAKGEATGQSCGAGEPVAICGVNASEGIPCQTLS